MPRTLVEELIRTIEVHSQKNRQVTTSELIGDLELIKALILQESVQQAVTQAQEEEE